MFASMHKLRNLLNLLGNVCIWRITLAKLWLAKTIVRVINKVAFTKRRGVRNDKKSLRNWVRPRISTWRTAPMNSCLRQHQVIPRRNGFSYRFKKFVIFHVSHTRSIIYLVCIFKLQTKFVFVIRIFELGP